MRTEEEMFRLILQVAEMDDRILAVYMNGSRTNKNAKKDIFQDYDIVYVVEQTKPFYEDKTWIDRFGERLYMQYPDEVDVLNGAEKDFDQSYGWLIQFKDGNRLDLHVVPRGNQDILKDKFCRILLDKHQILPDIPEATDEDYRIKKPSPNTFSASCNEFWWCLNNLTKGLWREEIPYIHSIIYECCHPELVKLLNWKIGYATGFRVSTGKASKYLKDWLPDHVWVRFLKTYPNGNIEDIWESVSVMCELFDETARELEQLSGFPYDSQEAQASYAFFKHVWTLPKDAKEIY